MSYADPGLFALPQAEQPIARRKGQSPVRNAATIEAGNAEYVAARQKHLDALPNSVVRNEAEMVRIKKGSIWTVQELYQAARELGLDERDGGHDIVQDGQMRYQRRVRNILQQLKRQGLAHRLGGGRWIISGDSNDSSPETEPSNQMQWGQLVVLGQPTHIRMLLADATKVETFQQFDEQPQAIWFDGPWGLDVDDTKANPARFNHSRDISDVVRGYQEIPKGMSPEEFWSKMIGPSAELLKEHGYLVMVSGPQQSGLLQHVGEHHGLRYVNKVAVKRIFAPRTTTRWAHAHLDVTVLTKGEKGSPDRYFAPLNDLPRSQSGLDYGLDFIDDMPKVEHRNEMKNKNELHMQLPDRFLRALTRERDLVVELCHGGGSMARVAALRNRRYIGVEINPLARDLAVGRLLTDVSRTISGEVAFGSGGLDLAALTRPQTIEERSRQTFVSRTPSFSF